MMVCLVLGGTGHYQGHVFTYKQQMGEVSVIIPQVQQVLHLKLTGLQAALLLLKQNVACAKKKPFLRCCCL